MFKIVAVPTPHTHSTIMQHSQTGDIRFVADIPVYELLKYRQITLYVVDDIPSITYVPCYIVTDSQGMSHAAIADSLNNDKPNIPLWLIQAWMKNPNVKFDVTYDLETNTLHFESEVSPEPSKKERDLKSFLDSIKVTKDDFDVVQLTKSNNIMLRHKKSQRVVILEKNLHKAFFAGLDYQVQQELWKFGENFEEVLVLKPLSRIVIL